MQNPKLILIVICLILLPPTLTFGARLYKWVDENGVVHVTDNAETIPKKHRDSIKILIPENKGYDRLAKIKELWNFSSSEKSLLFVGVAILAIVLLSYNILPIARSRLKQRKSLKRVEALKLSGIDKMNPDEFKNYICELLDRRGFNVETPDGAFNLGVDLIAQKKNVKYAVQLKKQPSAVSTLAIIDIEREKHRYDCKATMVITDNYFTEDAIQSANSNRCEIIDRETLADWVEDFSKKR